MAQGIQISRDVQGRLVVRFGAGTDNEGVRQAARALVDMVRPDDRQLVLITEPGAFGREHGGIWAEELAPLKGQFKMTVMVGIRSSIARLAIGAMARLSGERVRFCDREDDVPSLMA